jgi:membrane protease YdiL (CAAX protease family)
MTSSFFYLIVFSPFSEETTLRGFLYPAFRRDAGRIGAMLVVLAVAVYFHWGLVSSDLSAFILLALGVGILCAIREFTGSAWNCVLFHCEFNAIVVRNWTAAAFILVIAIWASRSGSKTNREGPSVSA